jgi:hypothetical protein
VRWLALFFLLAFVGGEILIQPLVVSTEAAGEHRSLAAMLIIDAVLVLPATAAGALVRFAVGRLSGFTAGIIGVVSCLATVNLAYGNWMTTDASMVVAFTLAKLLGPMLLARVAPLRTRALGFPPASEPTGLAGTRAFALAAGDSLAAALARRPAGERRWAKLVARVPASWSDGVARLATAPRPLPAGIGPALLLRGRSAPAWWWMTTGVLLLAAFDVERHLSQAPGGPSQGRLWLVVGLLLSALALLYCGAMRLLDAIRVARLLRHGELAFATPQATMIPGESQLVVATIAANAGPSDLRVAVETPRPRITGPRQGLLIDRVRRRVVAWDLMPYVPSIGPDGQLAAPPAGQILPWLIGPLATAIALAILAARLAF